MKKSFLTLLYCVTLSSTLISLSKAPLYLYAHGLADTAAQAFNYDGVLFDGPFSSFNFNDATKKFWRVNFPQTALGQFSEVERLANVIQGRIERESGMQFVGIGVSRGASTWLNYMSIYKHPSIKALVLESPFDSIQSIVHPVVHEVLGIATEYDTKGIQPREVIKHIPEDLPILITCLKDDHRVPYESTVEVYRILQESGHKNVHILVFETGKHGHFVKGENRTDYRNVAHAFYKKYGLPYSKKAAKAGKKLFKTTQPAPKDLL